MDACIDDRVVVPDNRVQEDPDNRVQEDSSRPWTASVAAAIAADDPGDELLSQRPTPPVFLTGRQKAAGRKLPARPPSSLLFFLSAMLADDARLLDISSVSHPSIGSASAHSSRDWARLGRR
jgi:hypothetical protein